MQDTVTVIISIIVEATPFLILGVLISLLAQRFKVFDFLVKRLPKNVAIRRLAISLFGVAMPVCECGNVPLARSLMRKGFSVGEATTFLLAAPILNPITFITTREAFRGVPWMLPARMLGGLLVALIVGYVIGRMGNKALTANFSKSCKRGHDEQTKEQGFSIGFANEFWNMFKLLAFGAVIAGLTQYFISQQSLAGAAGGVLVGVLIMLIMGFIISICSSVDAFFALAYSGTVRNGALLTFLIAGPMVDIKLLSMMHTTYKKKPLLVMTALISFFAVIIGVVFSYV